MDKAIDQTGTLNAKTAEIIGNKLLGVFMTQVGIYVALAIGFLDLLICRRIIDVPIIFIIVVAAAMVGCAIGYICLIFSLGKYKEMFTWVGIATILNGVLNVFEKTSPEGPIRLILSILTLALQILIIKWIATAIFECLLGIEERLRFIWPIYMRIFAALMVIGVIMPVCPYHITSDYGLAIYYIVYTLFWIVLIIVFIIEYVLILLSANALRKYAKNRADTEKAEQNAADTMQQSKEQMKTHQVNYWHQPDEQLSRQWILKEEQAIHELTENDNRTIRILSREDDNGSDGF